MKHFNKALLLFQSIWMINREMISFRGMIFLWLGGMASLYPYLTIHMKSLGISDQEIVIIFVCLPITSFIIPTIIGFLVDKFGRYKITFIIFLLLSAFFHTLLLFVPSTNIVKYRENHSMPLKYSCDATGSFIVPKNYLNSNCSKCSPVEFLQHSTFHLTDCFNLCDDPEDSVQIDEICLSAETDIMCYKIHKNNEVLSMHEVNLSFVDLYNDNRSFTSLPRFSFQHFHIKNHSYNGINCNMPSAVCSVTCNIDAELKNKNCDCEKMDGNHTKTFWIYLIIRILSNMTVVVIGMLLDSNIHNVIKISESSFGRERVWGLIGQLIFSTLSGILIYCANINGDDYSPAFYLFLGLTIFTAVLCYFTRILIESTPEITLKSLFLIFHDPNVNLFLSLVIIIGIFGGFSENFTFWYLKEMNAPAYILGLSIGIGALIAIPVVLASNHIIFAIGVFNIMILAGAIYGMRLTCYSFLMTPEWSLILESFEAFTSHLMWIAASLFANDITTTGFLTSLQGIMCGTYFGLGKGTGSFLTGILISKFESKLVFRGMGIAALIMSAVYLTMYHLWIKCKAKHFSQEQQALTNRKVQSSEAKEINKADQNSSEELKMKELAYDVIESVPGITIINSKENDFENDDDVYDDVIQNQSNFMINRTFRLEDLPEYIV